MLGRVCRRAGFGTAVPVGLPVVGKGAPRRRLTLLALLALLFVYHLVSPVKVGVVVGESMLPSLQNGGVYLLDRTAYRHHGVVPGDVVVLNRGGQRYVKRVIAVGGEVVHLMKHRGSEEYDLIPAKRLETARRVASHPRWSGTMKLVRWVLPPDTCFVLGDNFMDSIDSRHFGPITIDQIEGRVVGAAERQPEREWVRAEPVGPASS
ncbi:MAG: signal peptidase I [Armatimonadota bacterium]